MQLSLYNSLSRRKEIFKSLNQDLVKMYVCGPTVYDRPHIGNARSVVVYDVLYRILRHIYGSQHVLYVRNITDVDDKIIIRALETGSSISSLTVTVTKDFHQDTAYLNCLSPNLEPRATEHIPEMIMLIEKLINNHAAYVVEGHVFFDLAASSDYTQLSGRTLEQMLESVRIENSKFKKHPGDFVLWKPAHHQDEEAANFNSPWGKGRPGWHIECSAMSYKYLGENFDIHGGGSDLIFPHHTNEIAQSKCAFPGSNFAKFWVHNGFLTVGSEKMSKSLGNFITVKDWQDQQIAGETARVFLLSAHYRKPLDFNEKALVDAAKKVNYWYRALEGLEEKPVLSSSIPADFLNSLLDDINTPLAIKILHDYAKRAITATTQEEKRLYASNLITCGRLIGVIEQTPSQWFGASSEREEISKLIAQRNQARLEHNWQLADQIREVLLSRGITVEDKADGLTVWKKEK